MDEKNLQEEKEVLDKNFFLECMRTVIKKMNQQEQLMQLLVDDMNMRNHEGTLYLRGERMYSTKDLMNRLHLGKRTLDRYRKSGNLPFILLHNKAYYKESDVVKMIHSYSDKLDKKAAGDFLTQAKVNINNNN